LEVIKLLTGGGFGDAAMSIGKLYSKYAPFKVDLENIHLTHVEVGSSLLPVISEFYKTQGVDIKTEEIPNWQYKEDIRSQYDYYLGTHWSSNNVGDEYTWEINPFPYIKYDSIDNIDTVVHISSGRAEKFRGFTKDEIIELDNTFNNITFTGVSNDNFYSDYNFRNSNMVNKTSIQDLVNVLCSCNTFIGYAGFTLFLAGLAGKDIYGFRDPGDGWEYRVHPLWRVKQVSSIKDIK